MIDPITSIGQSRVHELPEQSNVNTANFSQFIADNINTLDMKVQNANQQLIDFASGKDVAVHDVMITMEEVRMNLMLMVEVRNKCVEAYQELMRMQL